MPSGNPCPDRGLKQPHISLIVAMTPDRVIGSHNKIPWRLPADLEYFRAVTMGKSIIMGRKTYESIGMPLKGRRNIVVTSQEDYRAEGCVVVHSLREALEEAGEGEIMVIGGGSIYKQMLPCASRLYVTWVEADIQGDTYFPVIESDRWNELSRQPVEANAENPYPYHFVVYERH